MRFTVIWSIDALDRLADLWLTARDRDAVTAAQHHIDQLLRVDPQTRGLPFFGNRLLFVPPLRALFFINWMDMVVEVYDVF